MEEEHTSTTPEQVANGHSQQQAVIAPEDSAFYVQNNTEEINANHVESGDYDGLSDASFLQRPELFLAATFFSGVVFARFFRRVRSR